MQVFQHFAIRAGSGDPGQGKTLPDEAPELPRASHSVQKLPRGSQEKAPVVSGRLWNALGCSGGLWEALGYSGKLWEALGGSGELLGCFWDAPGETQDKVKRYQTKLSGLGQPVLANS